MADAVEERGGRYLVNVSNYLKASLLDPSQCHAVSEYVKADIIEEAWKDITEEIYTQLAHDHPTMNPNMAEAGAAFQSALLRSTLENSKVPAETDDPLQYYRTVDGTSMGAALIVVRQLLCIPAGESHCERCFSWTDGFVTKLRNRTGNQALEMQLILYEEFSRPEFHWEPYRQAFLERIERDFKAKETAQAPQAKK
jgi:hypothetical protein